MDADLSHNATFSLVGQVEPSTPSYLPGIYRVVLDEPLSDLTVAALIQPEGSSITSHGGRPRKSVTKRKRKKAPQPLVGDLKWMSTEKLRQLEKDNLLAPVLLERYVSGLFDTSSEPSRNPDKPRAPHPLVQLRESVEVDIPAEPETRRQVLFEKRISVMADFLSYPKLRDSILCHHGIADLVRTAVQTGHVSRSFVYARFTELCRYGFDENSLQLDWPKCGAPGMPRRCDPGTHEEPGRMKAGRKTEEQRIAKRTLGIDLPPTQPGMCSLWASKIRVADKRIPSPKPKWPKRCDLIVKHAFGRAREVDGRFELVKPNLGEYPNDRQIQRVLSEVSPLRRILEKTTQNHFDRALRGNRGRNWEGVGGPGHQWAFDSTIGDIYLRSSVNRAWILGRPIVYVLVDVWSTAVVGFYICLTGPSWNTAKLALFNAAADPYLVGDLWGYEVVLSLNPHPSLPYQLLCDRGEYLSHKHRITAIELLPMTSYTAPYRPRGKGIVEVLHRIEKDAMFLFVPGAIDYRRQELELREVDPADSIYTLREFAALLYDLFTYYNLHADRRHRFDALFHEIPGGFEPNPAGLWRAGFDLGIGWRKAILEADLITHLLPSSTATVNRDAVRWIGCDYRSNEAESQDWTTIARNYGGYSIPINHYPMSTSRIWTPRATSPGMMTLSITDQSRASRELSQDEFADAVVLDIMRQPKLEHARKMYGIDLHGRLKALETTARALTGEAIAKAKGASPSIPQTRVIEVAAATYPTTEASEGAVIEQARDEALKTYEDAMRDILDAANRSG